MKFLRLSLVGVVVVCGAFVVVHSMLASFRLVPLIPYLDQLWLQDVFFLEAARGNENAFWHRLTKSNEHLVLFPMPLLWLDNELFAARGLSLVAVIHTINLFVAWVLARVASRAFGLSRAAFAAAFALFAATQSWGIHLVNLFWPMQVHMYCMLAAFAAGSWLWAESEARRSARLFAVAVACFLVSLFSFGYGVAACCGLLGVVICRAPWRWSASLALTVGLAFWFYLANMEPTARAANPAPPSGGQWLAGIAEYVLWFLSAPLVQWLAPVVPAGAANVIALVLTSFALATALVFVGRHLLRKGDVPPLRSFAAVWLLAAIAGACITAFARSGAGLEQARADRYAMMQVSFWNALLLAVASWLPARMRDRTLVGAGLAVLPLLLCSHLHLMGVLAPQVRSYVVAGEMAVLNEVDDPDPRALPVIHPSYKQHLPRVQAGMKERRWSIFAGPQVDWLGRPFAQVFPHLGSTVPGFVHAAAPVPGTPSAVRVGGWTGGNAAWIVLVDRAGRIAGVGKRLGLPVRPITELIPEWSMPVSFVCAGIDVSLDASGLWMGYARTDDPAGLTVYAIGDGSGSGDSASALAK